MRPPSAVPVALGLGSNLGDRRAAVRQAFTYLQDEVLNDAVCSSLYGSEPDDCPPGAPDFLNAAVIGYCDVSPHELLERCLDIECRMGRPRQRGYHTDRIIDLDILLYDQVILNEPELQIPHPGLTSRAYVLEPLASIAGSWMVPGTGKTVAQWWQDCKV